MKATLCALALRWFALDSLAGSDLGVRGDLELFVSVRLAGRRNAHVFASLPGVHTVSLLKLLLRCTGDGFTSKLFTSVETRIPMTLLATLRRELVRC